jgi:hypothetical protein
MDRKLAKRKMLLPRKTRAIIGGTPSWYYVEDARTVRAPSRS